MAVLGIAALALAAMVLLDRVALGMMRPARRPVAREPDALEMAFSSWTIPGAPPLEAWDIPGQDPAGPVVILAHGWGANAAVVLPLARRVAGLSARIVAFDVRGHGRSDDAPKVSLRQFRDDALRAARAVMAREERRDGSTPAIVMVGHSMGGTAAVLAAGEGAPLAGLVLVAAPCDIFGTVARYLTEKGLPGGLLVPMTRPFFRLRVGLPERDLSPARVLPELDIPVCVIQPAEDTRVPPSEGRRLAELAGTGMHLVEGAGHTSILENDRAGAILGEFVAGFRRKGDEGA